MRCGRKTDNYEYGADGLVYCEDCAFYGMNRQCHICGIYLPYSEMRSYRGEWVCPTCMNDLSSSKRKKRADKFRLKEKCQRCGKKTQFFYYYKGRKLCTSCFDYEQSKWGTAGGGPSSSKQRFMRPIKVTKKPSLLERFINYVLSLFGIEKTKVEVVKIKRKRIKAKPKTEPIQKKDHYALKTEPIMKNKTLKNKKEQ